MMTSPTIATVKLVVDADVASSTFRWREFALRYVDIARGSELIASFMTLAKILFVPAPARTRGN